MCECGGMEKVRRSPVKKPVTDKKKPKPESSQRELADKDKSGTLKK